MKIIHNLFAIVKNIGLGIIILIMLPPSETNEYEHKLDKKGYNGSDYELQEAIFLNDGFLPIETEDELNENCGYTLRKHNDTNILSSITIGRACDYSAIYDTPLGLIVYLSTDDWDKYFHHQDIDEAIELSVRHLKERINKYKFKKDNSTFNIQIDVDDCNIYNKLTIPDVLKL